MASQLAWPLRVVRGVLRRLNYHLSSTRKKALAEPFDTARLRQAEEAFRNMPAKDAGAKAYLEKHIPRLARTVALVPPPQATGRVLELGCYMQITPMLEASGFDSENRGEQSWCLAVKRSALPVDRYPYFIYTP